MAAAASDRYLAAHGLRSTALAVSTGGGAGKSAGHRSGQTWWQAFLGEQVLSVSFQNNRLIAIVQQQTTNQGLKAVTQVYVSKDGGRHWLYNDELRAL